MDTLHLLHPSTNLDLYINYISTRTKCAVLSGPNTVADTARLACTGIHCGLKYQHWPMKPT